jgi:hypothetical protein
MGFVQRLCGIPARQEGQTDKALDNCLAHDDEPWRKSLMAERHTTHYPFGKLRGLSCLDDGRALFSFC